MAVLHIGRDAKACVRVNAQASTLLNDNVGARQDSVSEYFSAARREIGPLYRLLVLLLGNNVGDDAITIPQLHGLPRPQQALEPAVSRSWRMFMECIPTM